MTDLTPEDRKKIRKILDLYDVFLLSDIEMGSDRVIRFTVRGIASRDGSVALRALGQEGLNFGDGDLQTDGNNAKAKDADGKVLVEIPLNEGGVWR